MFKLYFHQKRLLYCKTNMSGAIVYRALLGWEKDIRGIGFTDLLHLLDSVVIIGVDL